VDGHAVIVVALIVNFNDFTTYPVIFCRYMANIGKYCITR